MRFLSGWLLTVFLLVPLAGAAAVGILRRRAIVVRRVALGTTLAACAVSLLVLVPFRWRQALTYDPGPHGSIKLPLRSPMPLGTEYYVAVDGLSFPFVVFTTVMFAMLIVASWHEASSAGYYAILLGVEFATLGTYLCFDLLMMLAFLALAAGAVYALVRSTGDEAKVRRLMAIYLALGLTCVAVAAVTIRSANGTFDLVRLAEFGLKGASIPGWVLVVLVFGFLFRMGAPPVHSWLTTTLSVAPTPVAIAIASVMPMTGGYALIRVVMPTLPHASVAVWGGFGVLGLAGFLYGALCAMASESLRSFVGYSTASMMGCVLFAVTLRSPGAIDGAVVLLVGQGLVGAMLLLLAGRTSGESTGEREPIWTAFFGIAWVGWLTAPLLMGQLAVLLAGFEAARAGGSLRLGGVALPGPGYGLAVAASFGVLANGVAAARMIRKVFLPKTQAAEGTSTDLKTADITVLAVLGTIAILVGIAPGVFVFTFTHPAARALLRTP